MKKLLLLFCIPLIFSCSQSGDSDDSGSGNILENLTYTTDTLVVDSKGEIINLKYGMSFFDISPDRKSLFVYDYEQTLFQEIDLDQMVLEGTYPFEKEGPNGLGRSSYFQILPNGTLMIPTFPNSGIYNLQGDLLTQIKLRPEDIEGIDASSPYALVYEILIDPKTGILYSLPGDFLVGVRELAVIDSKTNKGKTVKLPEMEKAGKFRVFWNSETGGSIQAENYTLTLIDDKIFITCTVGSGIYIFDPKTDSLEYVDFPHKIIPTEKSGEIQNEMSEQDVFWNEMKKVVSQVSYKELYWDRESSRFYRLASRSFLGEKRGDPAKYENYLLMYDRDLTLLGESAIDGLESSLDSYFWKDGKLYSYINADDELGFAVFNFDF